MLKLWVQPSGPLAPVPLIRIKMGSFSAGLGDTGGGDNECGPAITAAVFSENPNLWLEVTVDTSPNDEILTPRQPIRTVGYAANAETLQGYPLAPTGGATANTVLT